MTTERPVEDLDFAGAEEILRAWYSGLAPDPDLTVSEWADRHRFLSARGAAEPGPYRTDRTPYLREIMDRLSPNDPVQRVVVMKAAQIGATEAGNNWIGYVIHHVPGPMLAVQPTVELAKRFSRQRVDPLIAESPVLRERVVRARSRHSGNTMLSKEFPAGLLVITGANSAVGLRSMPARYLFLDEIDAYPQSADEEGDPLALAEARTLTFAHRRKIFIVSTPTVHGVSRIEREFEATDRRRYFVPCPHCGHQQWLRFERLRWERGRPETARYYCEQCERPISEEHKSAMLARGQWRPTAESADRSTVGYHLSALYSPIGWLSWAAIARQWEGAQGSDEALKTFKNTILGETWVEKGEAPEWERLYERRESYRIGTVPSGVVLLTAGVDVQKDRFEVDVWGWGPGIESWLVDHETIDGGPNSEGAWGELEEFVRRTWRSQDGIDLPLARVAIDTGFEASAVYSWSRKIGFDLIAPVKGYDGWGRAPVLGPTYVDFTETGKKVKRGARLWTIATSTFKVELYRQLRLTAPTDEELEAGAGYPAGYVHFPRGIEGEWFRQLVAEQLVTVKAKRRGAAPRLEWHKIRERNEALDCRVYARAAAWLVGIDRWTEEQWRAYTPKKRGAARANARAPVDVSVPVADNRRRSDWLGGRRSWL